MKKLTDDVKKEYAEWLINKGKLEYKETDIYVVKDGKVATEKRMVHVGNITPEDWKEFCMATGKEYEGEMKLLAIY